MSKLEQAAQDYAWKNGYKTSDGCEFRAGADWAVKNDPRVLKLVETFKKISDPTSALTESRNQSYADWELRRIARQTLTEWERENEEK
jgi:hypothetical protein